MMKVEKLQESFKFKLKDWLLIAEYSYDNYKQKQKSKKRKRRMTIFNPILTAEKIH